MGARDSSDPRLTFLDSRACQPRPPFLFGVVFFSDSALEARDFAEPLLLDVLHFMGHCSWNRVSSLEDNRSLSRHGIGPCVLTDHLADSVGNTFDST